MESFGILVATNETLEWLLRWWWSHYSKHNDYPVAFCDFGMTKEARTWCEKKGTVFHLDSLNLPSFGKETLSADERKRWESYFPDSIWQRRPLWFQKPFALARSPFDRTLWIDVDCEVRGSLDPLFSYLHFGIEMAIAKEREEVQIMERKRGFLFPDEICYNSGVIAYLKNASFLHLWMEKIRTDHPLFITDQHALSRVLFEQDIPKMELSSHYNWSMHDGPNDDALIHHYHGALKMEIFNKIPICYTERDSKLDLG